MCLFSLCHASLLSLVSQMAWHSETVTGEKRRGEEKKESKRGCHWREKPCVVQSWKNSQWQVCLVIGCCKLNQLNHSLLFAFTVRETAYACTIAVAVAQQQSLHTQSKIFYYRRRQHLATVHQCQVKYSLEARPCIACTHHVKQKQEKKTKRHENSVTATTVR